MRVMLGYAHASFALGDDAQAVTMYRKLLATAGQLPGVERNLAHVLVRQGKDLEEALAMLGRAEREATDAPRQHELKLLRALAHAKLGDRERARELLGETPVHEQTSKLRDELSALLKAPSDRA